MSLQRHRINLYKKLLKMIGAIGSFEFVSIFLVCLSVFALFSSFPPMAFALPDPYIDGTIKDGWVTYYTEWKWAYGSCGVIPTTPEYVCALSSKYMAFPNGKGNPNNHPLCGPKYCVLVRGERGSAVVKISDTCGACIRDGGDNLDLADELYPMVTDPIKGKNNIQWKFVDCAIYHPGKFNGDQDSEFPHFPYKKHAMRSPTTDL